MVIRYIDGKCFAINEPEADAQVVVNCNCMLQLLFVKRHVTHVNPPVGTLAYVKYENLWIDNASSDSLDFLLEHDRHVSSEVLVRKVDAGEVLVALADGAPVGWFRWSLFWDSIPLLNMLFLLEGWRGCGLGRALVEHWTAVVRDSGYQRVMTSTQSNESGQHFFRHLGFVDAGSLELPSEPLEILLLKQLGQKVTT